MIAAWVDTARRLFFGAPERMSRSFSIPERTLVYAIGDIHGRLDLLHLLLAEIRAHAGRFPANWTRRLVFLGDYVDRGPDSAGTIEFLCGAPPDGFTWDFLAGNHEQAMLAFLATDAPDPRWLQFGGLATLDSYKIHTSGSTVAALKNSLNQRLPTQHNDFLRNLKPLLVVGDYVFVHAGLRPGVPLARQVEQDLLWIREPFLSADDYFEHRVVHGHTVFPVPQVLPNRIGIDTGAYASGTLTAVALWSDCFEFLTGSAA